MILLGLLIWTAPLMMALTAGVWAIVVIARALTLPGDLRGRPGCAVCTYPVTTVSIERCPECGTPYLVGGIRTPRSATRDRSSTLGALIAWTFLVAGGGIIAAIVLGIVYSSTIAFGALQSAKGVAVYRPIAHSTTPGVVRDGPDYALEFAVDAAWDWSNRTVDANGNPTSPGSGTISVTLLVDDQPASSLVFDLASPDPLSEDDALAMFIDAGLDIDDEVIGYEARQLPALLDDWTDDPTHGYEFYSSAAGEPISGDEAINPPLRDAAGEPIAGWGEVNYTDTNFAGGGPFNEPPPLWYFMTVIGTALAVLAIWGLGIWLIVHRRRSMLRTLSTPPPTQPPPTQPTATQANPAVPPAVSPTE